MKQIFTILLSALLLFSVSSCSEDLLDIQQRGVLSEANYYQTDDDAISSVATLYRLWKEELYGGAYFCSHFTPDCYAGGGIRNDNVQYEQQNEFRYTTENTNISTYFKKLYTMIYNANTILEKYSDDTPAKKQVKAEAHFFRAYCNFMLVTLWGTPYFVDHVLAASEYQMANAESTDIFWTAIEADLNEAINSGCLPSKSSLNDYQSRVTKECAIAYLGKVYLWEKKYSEAAKAFDQVINSGKYALLDDPSKLLHTDADHCCEYLAEAEALLDYTNWTKQDGLSGFNYCWKTSNSIVLTKNTANWPYTTGGYGFFNPTKSFVDMVRNVEGENGKRFKNYFVTWDYMVENYGATATRNHFFNEGWFQTKLLTKKGDDFSAMGAWGWIYTHQNWPHMRYAEVLLMAAEANMYINDMPSAVKYFNQVRQRADAPTVSSLTIDDILIERRIELWGETPAIFQDIQRYRLGEKLCGNQYAKYPVYTLIGDYKDNPQVIWYDNGNEEYGFKEKHYLLPYSSSELLANPNLKQNPGWGEAE